MTAGSSNPPRGYTGRVTGEVKPGSIGEVVIRIRGGSETFYAYALNEGETIPIGSNVLVVTYVPPREVHVVPWVENEVIPATS